MSADDEDTPVQVPFLRPPKNGSQRGSLDDLQGVPVALPFEESDRFSKVLLGSVENTAAKLSSEDEPAVTSNDILDVLAKKLVKHGGGGSGGMPPEAFKKQNAKHNWITVILALLLGPGGAFAVIRAMDDRSKSNEHGIKAVTKTIDEDFKPRMEKTEKDVNYIKIRIGKVDEKVDKAMTQQTTIVDGIEELKKENVNRLKDELDDARRELRRVNRDR